ncbi:MAG: EutN/CcmL family microcompartment protein, partial [Bacteroidota bacterium]
MFLAKVIGNVVSTPKNRHLVGHKLLVVHPINENQQLSGNKDVITLDLVNS